MHDNHIGSVTSIDISFDGGYVISVGKFFSMYYSD